MKRCSKCRKEKGEEEFNFSARHRYKLQSYCQDCQTEYSEEYAPKNRENLKAATDRWRAQNANYPQIEAVRKAVSRLIKVGGDKIHPKLGYSGATLQQHLGIQTFSRGCFDFKVPLDNFNLPAEFDKAGALENIIVR